MDERLEKNQIHEAVITGCTSEGQGVARVAGQAVFVNGALPGERCRIRILKAGKTAVYARIEELLTPSPHRIQPDCPCYGKCGGCDFRHVDYPEELRIKLERLNDALQRIGGLNCGPKRSCPRRRRTGTAPKPYSTWERIGRESPSPVFSGPEVMR